MLATVFFYFIIVSKVNVKLFMLCDIKGIKIRNSQCQRVRDIKWGRRFLQIQQNLDHLLDLALIRPAVSHHRFLHPAGGIGSNRNIPLRGGQTADSPYFPQCYGRPDILTVKNIFQDKSLGESILPSSW